MRYYRYHRYTVDNVKQMRRFPVGVIPENDSQYSDWARGTGPFSPQATLNITAGIRRACLGVPKTPEQKEKMRQAKLGVPKSAAHKAAMSKAQLARKKK